MVAKKGISKLWIYITAASLPIIFFVIIMTMSILNINASKQFILDITDDFAYSIENNSLTAEYQNISTRITEKNNKNIFSEIMYDDFMIYKDEFQESEGIVLEFGNGNTLIVYYLDSTEILLQYIPEGEDAKAFRNSDLIRFVTFERLVSPEWDNEVIAN